MVYAEDLHVDKNTHELVVEEHGHHGEGLTHVITEAGKPGYDENRVETIEEKV